MTHILKDIAVFFDSGEEGVRILELAATLASAQDALLIGLYASTPEKALPEDTFVRGEALSELLQERESDAAKRLAEAETVLNRIARQYDIEVEFRTVSYAENRRDLFSHSLYYDLIIVSEALVDLPLTWSSTDALRKTGVPILLIPKGWEKSTVGRHIVLGWNGSRQARRAVADAMPLLIAAQSVDLLIVDPERSVTSSDEPPGIDMAAYLAHHDVEVRLVCIASEGHSVADTILEQAHLRGADLIVVGIYSHSRLKEAIFGGVTHSLFHDVDLPLLISY